MAAAKVQDVVTGGYASSASAASHVLTVGVTTTVGNHLILRCLSSNTARTLGVTDSKGNTWQVDRTGSATAPVTYSASAKITSALVSSDTITITWTGGSATTAAWVIEVSGLATSSWYDQGADAAGTSTAADSGATGTLAQADNFVVGQVAMSGTTTSYAWETTSPTWTNEGTTTTTGTVREEHFGSKVISATTALNAKATWTTSRTWHSQIDVYKAAATSGITFIDELHVALNGTTGSTNNLDATFNSDQTAVMVIVWISWDTSTESVVTVNDPQGNLYVRADDEIFNVPNAAIWYSPAPINVFTADAIDVEFTGVIGSHVGGWIVSGVGGLDKVSSASATSTAPDSGATATTSTANEFLAELVTTDTAHAVTWASGEITGTFPTGGSDDRPHPGYRIVSSTGTYKSAGTITSAQWTSIIATFRAGITVVPAQVDLVLTTFAPTVSVSNNQTVTPPVVALVLTTFAPQLRLSVIPATVALTLSTFAPTVTVSGNQTVTPSVVALVLTTFAPQVNLAVFPTTATLTLSTFAPQVNLAVTPAVLPLVLTTFAPQVNLAVIPPTVALVLATFAPTVTVGGSQVVTPATLGLTLSTFAPTVLAGGLRGHPGFASLSRFSRTDTTDITDDDDETIALLA